MDPNRDSGARGAIAVSVLIALMVAELGGVPAIIAAAKSPKSAKPSKKALLAAAKSFEQDLLSGKFQAAYRRLTPDDRKHCSKQAFGPIANLVYLDHGAHVTVVSKQSGISEHDGHYSGSVWFVVRRGGLPIFQGWSVYLAGGKMTVPTTPPWIFQHGKWWADDVGAGCTLKYTSSPSSATPGLT